MAIAHGARTLVVRQMDAAELAAARARMARRQADEKASVNRGCTTFGADAEYDFGWVVDAAGDAYVRGANRYWTA